MHEEMAARLYNQVLLNRAYMKTILANQCIMLAQQTGNRTDHKVLYEKFHKEVIHQYRMILKDDRKSVMKDDSE